MNPLQLIGMLRNGGNPQVILQQMAGNNPQMRQVMQMVQGKNPQELQQMAMNMCRERGTTPQDVMKSLGIM